MYTLILLYNYRKNYPIPAEAWPLAFVADIVLAYLIYLLICTN